MFCIYKPFLQVSFVFVCRLGSFWNVSTQQTVAGAIETAPLNYFFMLFFLLCLRVRAAPTIHLIKGGRSLIATR